MKRNIKEYFEDKKVFLTGHTGFKGSWMSQYLLNLGANVIGVSKDVPTKPSMFETLELESRLINIKDNIINHGKIKDIMIEYNPDIIIHLAAQPLVRKSYLDPVETYQTNIMGTISILESIRKLNMAHKDENKVFLNITTDKCYENKEQNYSYSEDDPLGGYDPYSSSKACSEIVTSAYRRSYFNNGDCNSRINVATARAGNIIGGGDWSEDRLVVDCVKSLVSDEKIVIRNPQAMRPWQHVLDGLFGYLTLITHMIDMYCENDASSNSENIFNSAWNFGPKDENIENVESLVKKLIDFWGNGDYVVKNDDKFHESILLKLNINKSLSFLDWKPILSLDESVKFTVDWYKEYYFNNADMLEFTNKQIKNYTKKT